MDVIETFRRDEAGPIVLPILNDALHLPGREVLECADAVCDFAPP